MSSLVSADLEGDSLTSPQGGTLQISPEAGWWPKWHRHLAGPRGTEKRRRVGPHFYQDLHQPLQRQLPLSEHLCVWACPRGARSRGA